MADVEPGQIIIPHGPNDQGSDDPASAAASQPQPEQPAPQTASAPTPSPVLAGTAAEAYSPESEAAGPTPETALPESEAPSGWQFRQETDAGDDLSEESRAGLSWMGTEFIRHDKGINWYGALTASGIVVAALVYIVTRDKISTGTILLIVLLFGMYAARKPRMRQYSLDSGMLRIEAKTYPLHEFKAFSIADEGAVMGIVLMPLKRFMPPLTLYVTPDVQPQVTEFLSAYLPFQAHKADAIDSLLRWIRF